jgi:hypothetical protein
MGTERDKGSHSMAGYHSFELCYLASVYTNLLITKQPMDFYFAPLPKAYVGGLLRVSPDLLPAAAVSITKVEIDGAQWDAYDAARLTVTLPQSSDRLRVKVTLAPRP